jgi:hypothetical protein
MASNINTTDIDAEYPVAGQDNDSQGFRDNFSTIKDNFVAAKSEIETLQSETAKINDNNDFSENVISNAGLENVWHETSLLGGVDADSQILNFGDGSFQSFTTARSVAIQFDGWPASGKYARMRISVRSNSDGDSRTVTFGGATIKYSEGFFDGTDTFVPLTVDSISNPKVVDVWTTDGGVSLYVEYVGEFKGS